MSSEGLSAPLLEKNNESPRQKKNRIIREFGESNFSLQAIGEKLTPECLNEIELLSESYIEAIVQSSFTVPSKKYRTRNSFDAFWGKFSQLGEKTKKVFARLAFRLHKEIAIPHHPYFANDEFVFFHADQLAQKSANYGRTRKFFFYRSQRHAVSLIAQHIVNVLTPRGDVANPALGLLALQIDEFEQYKQACLRLEQLPPYVIAAFFKNLYTVPADLQERREEIIAAAGKIAEAIEYVITHTDSKDLFPHLTLFFAQMETRATLGRAVGSMSLKVFQTALDDPKLRSVEGLQSIIRCLVEEIETSVIKGKYEDMLELCLVRLMRLSDPHKGLNLDPAQLAKCLTIIDNYYLHSNRAKFFNYVSDDGYTMLAYIRRAVPSFEKYPKLQPLVENHDGMDTVVADAINDESLLDLVKSGRIDAQRLLAATVKESGFNQRLAQRLVEKCGADLDSPDMFSMHHRKDGDLPCESFLYQALRVHELGEPWNFYLSRKEEQRESVNDVLSTVIEFYINCLRTLFGSNVLLGGCQDAIEQLLQNANVVVTQAMLDKFNVLPERVVQENGVRKKLQKKMDALLSRQPKPQPLVLPQSSSAGSGKGKEEEEEVPVARAAAAPVIPAIVEGLLEEGNLAKLKEVLSDESPDTQVVNAVVYSLGGETLKGLPPGLKHELCRCDLTEVAKAKLNQHGFGAYLLSGIIYKGGDVSELEKCKASGVDVHAQDEYGHTGLYAAVQFSNGVALNWLVSQGVKPSEKDLSKAGILRSFEAKSAEVAVVPPASAALLGDVVGRGAHPVHARRISDGAPAAAELKPSPTLGAK